MKRYWLLRFMAWLTLAAGLLGCNAARVFVASPSDYGDYRRIRLAKSLDDRLAAAAYYLNEHPDGAYTKRVRRYFKAAEPVFFKFRRRNAKGLEAYLRALPHGPNRASALAKLSRARFNQRREDLSKRMARSTALRLDSEQKQREAATDLLRWWVVQWLQPGVWRQPLSSAPKELLVPYRLTLPAPVCSIEGAQGELVRCQKRIHQRFRIPGQGELLDRELWAWMTVELDEAWRPRAIEIAGPELFLRVSEARDRRVRSGPGERVAAAQRFAEQLSAALVDEGLVCNGGSDARGRLEMDCEGLGLWVLPGRGPDVDQLRIRPVSPDGG